MLISIDIYIIPQSNPTHTKRYIPHLIDASYKP